MKKWFFGIAVLAFYSIDFAMERQLILRRSSAVDRQLQDEVDRKNYALVKGVRNLLPCAAVLSSITLGIGCCVLCNADVDVLCVSQVAGTYCAGACVIWGLEGCDQISASNVCQDPHCLKKCGAVWARECCYGSGCCPQFILKRLDDILKKDVSCAPFLCY